MPFKVVKVPGGWKVFNMKTGKTYSQKPLSKLMAERQMLAIIISEHRKSMV
jgi:hypothetical protein